MVICQWSSSELAQAAGRKGALLGTVQVMNRADCLLAQEWLSRREEVRITRDCPGKLYRWIYLMRSFVSGQNELFTVPPRSEVNDTEWALNILQLLPESGYCSQGTGTRERSIATCLICVVLLSAWSQGPIPERVFSLLLPESEIIHSQAWCQEAPQYCYKEKKFTHQPLVPGNWLREREFTHSINS